ncbi:hypothetical protein [Kitasatospora sp. NPDC097643]|uniref:hypothetical protein n=1 Tax=Kitasatospora sp. NPDC097643 TaxID=3157230 RepID=UPI00331CA758
MPAELAARLVARPTASRLLLGGAGLWGIAPFYAMAARPSPVNVDALPPRSEWGAAEYETEQLNSLVVTISGLMILTVAAAGAWFWAYAAMRVRRGKPVTSGFVIGTALGTGLLAVVGTRRIFHTLESAPALGVLVPLLAASLAALALAVAARKAPSES